MPFPLVKLGALLIKRMSSPIANYIKEKAKTEPFLMNKILVPQAQVYHRIDTAFKSKMLDVGKIKAKPLGEENAINLAAEMLGEFVIISIFSLVIYAEYKRQQYKDQDKEDLHNQRILSLESEISKLTAKVEILWEERSNPKPAEPPVERKEETRPDDEISDVPSQIRDSKSKVVLRVDKKREDPTDEK